MRNSRRQIKRLMGNLSLMKNMISLRKRRRNRRKLKRLKKSNIYQSRRPKMNILKTLRKSLILQKLQIKRKTKNHKL